MLRLTLLLSLLLTSLSFGQDSPSWTRKEDVIYGRKYGLAMTMDVFTPKKTPNGAGVIFCVSGGWFSAKQSINPLFINEFTDRGYVVFAVVHGSQPRFSIPEVLQDMHRATRFIRTNAKTYGVDPERLGITGGSAGGHLSLMQGMAGNDGNAKATDPVERASSRVAAVGCFFPPTDFMNYRKAGDEAIGNNVLKGFKAPFEFVEMEKGTNAIVVIKDEEKRREIAKFISPVTHVTDKAPPTMIIHGDADLLVPIYQAEIMIDKLKAANVPCELVVKKGAAHGWAGMDKDLKTIADWFDKHLAKKDTK